MATVSIPKRTHDLFQVFNDEVGFSSPQQAIAALLVVCRELGRDEESGLRIKSSERAESSIAASELLDGNMESVRLFYQEGNAVEIDVDDAALSRVNDPLISDRQMRDFGQMHERLAAMMSLGLAIYNNMPLEGKDRIIVPVVDKRNPMECALRPINLRAEL